MKDKYALKFGKIDDLASYMDLVTLVRHDFPPLIDNEELEKHKQTVIKNINRKADIHNGSANEKGRVL